MSSFALVMIMATILIIKMGKWAAKNPGQSADAAKWITSMFKK